MPRGMYLHAERLLAKAGVARRNGEGSPHPWRAAEGETERAERSGGLHKRRRGPRRGLLPAGVTSAEDWGSPCDARGAGPLVSLSSFGVRGSAPESQDGRCGREQPAEEGGGGRRRSVAREDASALTRRMLSQSRSCPNSANKLSTGPFQQERRLAHAATIVTWRQTLE